MNKAPAFQFYPDDFVGGVADMTQAEVGAYILLLCAQWGRGEIPLDPERAALAAKGPVSHHVFSKFPGGKNARMERVRAGLEAYKAAQSERAHMRWDKPRNASAMPPHMQAQCSPSPSPSPVSVSNLQSPPSGGLGAKPPVLDGKCPLQLRAEKLLKKRASTPWSRAELTAWKGAKAIVADSTPEEWADLEAWFALPSAPFRRQSLSVLLNNWQAEIIRARQPENLALVAAAPDAASIELGRKQRAAF